MTKREKLEEILDRFGRMYEHVPLQGKYRHVVVCQIEALYKIKYPKKKKTLPHGLGSPYNPAQSKINGYNQAIDETQRLNGGE